MPMSIRRVAAFSNNHLRIVALGPVFDHLPEDIDL